MSPILDTLLTATTLAPSTTTPLSDTLDALLLQTSPPSSVPSVVTAAPAVVDQLSQLSDLGTTAPPTTAVDSTVPRNDHSNELSRSRMAKVDAQALAALTAETSIGNNDMPWLRPLISAVLGTTVLLLGFFHFQAIHPESVAPDAYAEALWQPNSWELPLFLSALQHVAVLALTKNNNRPQLVYIRFLDNFSWSIFLVPSLSATTASSTATTVSTAVLSRRLTSYDPSGFVQFALRSGVREQDWFVRFMATVLCVIALLLLVIVASGAWAYVASRAAVGYDSESASAHSRYVQLRTLSHQCLGLLVVIGFLAVLPLVYIAVVEILQDGSTSLLSSTNGLLAVATLLLLLFSAVVLLRWLHRQSRIALAKWRVRIVFGVLYANMQYDRRCFIGAVFILEAIVAGIVAALTLDGVSQLLALIVVHGLFILLILHRRPFSSRVHLHATLGVEGFLLVLYGLGAALNMRITIQTQLVLSYTAVSLITLAVVGVWVRQLVLLAKYAGCSANKTAVARDDALLDMGHLPLTTSRGRRRPPAATL